MGHTANARRQPVGWTDDTPQRITEWGEAWEITCTECGDDLGPYEGQGPSIQALRGPYQDVEEAKRAVTRHNRDDT